MSNIVYLNGAFLPADDARISVFDGGFLHGAGLFETMRADYGRVADGALPGDKVQSHMGP